MNYSNAIETALEAANSAILLNSAAQVSRAAKAWQRSEVLGLDTEFVRERTYYANIGLVQLSDGHSVWLVDPLVDGALGPLKSLLENQSISKIVHSPSEDLEVLLHAVGAAPEPMIDTQMACALLGQPLQMGYHSAAQWLLDVNVDKDQTRSNWCARPLRAAQLRYAALDVCLLPLMWEKLKHGLDEKSRLQWLEEDCNKTLQKSRQALDVSNSWQRIRGNSRLDGTGLAILQALAQWREHEARRRNLPRGFVMKDPVLMAISNRRMDSVTALESIDDLHPRAIERHGETISRLVKSVIASGHQLETVEPMPPAMRKQLLAMREMVQAKAKQLGVEAAVLASRRDLESLLQNVNNEWPEKLQGWREHELGPDFETILNQT